MTNPLVLQSKELKIRFTMEGVCTQAVNGISFALGKGQVLAMVGESGSGKSVTALSFTQLLPPVCEVSGQILYQERNLLKATKDEIRKIRGKEIAYIFQEPSASLNPVFTIGFQIAEALQLRQLNQKEAQEQTVELLRKVGIPEPEKRRKCYPHEFSGGMQQRVMIAMAIACQPAILVADEPTSKLDVTIQKQILELLKQLQLEYGMSIIFITHHLGIVADFADEMVVMLRGNIVESGPAREILRAPQHPYTKALIACIPVLGAKQKRLRSIDYAAISQ